MGGRCGWRARSGAALPSTSRSSAEPAPATSRRDLHRGAAPRRPAPADGGRQRHQPPDRRCRPATWGMVARAQRGAGRGAGWVRQGDPFDVAILDMQMPGMDGLDLARASGDAMPGLPLVLFSSLGRREAGAERGGVRGLSRETTSSLPNSSTRWSACSRAGRPVVPEPRRPGRPRSADGRATAVAYPARGGQRRQPEAGDAPAAANGLPRRCRGQRPGGDRGAGASALRRDPDGRANAGDGRTGSLAADPRAGRAASGRGSSP